MAAKLVLRFSVISPSTVIFSIVANSRNLRFTGVPIAFSANSSQLSALSKTSTNVAVLHPRQQTTQI